MSKYVTLFIRSSRIENWSSTYRKCSKAALYTENCPVAFGIALMGAIKRFFTFTVVIIVDDLAQRIADALADDEEEDITWAGQFKK